MKKFFGCPKSALIRLTRGNNKTEEVRGFTHKGSMYAILKSCFIHQFGCVCVCVVGGGVILMH